MKLFYINEILNGVGLDTSKEGWKKWTENQHGVYEKTIKENENNNEQDGDWIGEFDKTWRPGSENTLTATHTQSNVRAHTHEKLQLLNFGLYVAFLF